jgi:serine protease AprX
MLHPDARLGASYFKGTGTSQATAVVSGIVALMLQVRPSLTPNQVKAILKATVKVGASKAGMVNAAAALALAATYLLPGANQGLARSTGLGKIDLSRGSFYVYSSPGAGTSNPKLVTGEIDALWNRWLPVSWGASAWWSSPFIDFSAATTGWADAFAKKGWHGTSWSSTAWDKKGWHEAGWDPSTWISIHPKLGGWG